MPRGSFLENNTTRLSLSRTCLRMSRAKVMKEKYEDAADAANLDR